MDCFHPEEGDQDQFLMNLKFLTSHKDLARGTQSHDYKVSPSLVSRGFIKVETTNVVHPVDVAAMVAGRHDRR